MAAHDALTFDANPCHDPFYVLNVLFHAVADYGFRYFKLGIFLSILIIICLIIYKSYCSPVIYKKELSEVGYEHLSKGSDRPLHILRAQNTRRLGDKLPPPYPNGWFALVESRDLKVGSVIPVDAMGLNFCVYRGEDGVARIVDAYCPHLGANLAVGGTVCGNCIECPFHQWRFGENGDCVSIPNVEAVPKGISIKTHHAMEIDGAVWVWYDVEGREPLWTVDRIPELDTWGYRGRNEFIVNAHLQEIPENGADVAHLNAVHTVSMLSDVGFKYPFLNHFIGYHTWNAEWLKGDDHTASMKITQKYLIMKLDIFPIDVTVTQIGPAHVRLMFTSPLGPMVVLQSVTPLGPLLQRVIHRVYTPTLNAPLGAALVVLEAYQFQRDVAIWNSKRYVNSPTYVKSDKTIRAFRTWFSQFYSKNSIPLRDAMQNPLDW
ncbi:Rieske-domain protein neverland [Danaus plexippus plexippus]|uniref:cholesterol 7-desaturase n=1 Tax=Danaus plexippus plexippus TaxID=278856 RepID=A0A212EYT7_DANPL|nr:cholesterol 7-desaturase-like [Danaus plexippus plexippus]OWR46621.1 Rieske-domain protein neverland [Danaus plexippus plexippus]